MKPREIIQGKLEIYRENKIILPLNKILRISQDTFTNSKSIAADSITENFKRFKLNLKNGIILNRIKERRQSSLNAKTEEQSEREKIMNSNENQIQCKFNELRTYRSQRVLNPVINSDPLIENKSDLNYKLFDSAHKNSRNENFVNLRAKCSSKLSNNTPLIQDEVNFFNKITNQDSLDIINQTKFKCPEIRNSKYNYCRQNKGKQSILSRLKKLQIKKTPGSLQEFDNLEQIDDINNLGTDVSDEEIMNVDPCRISCTQQQSDTIPLKICCLPAMTLQKLI